MCYTGGGVVAATTGHTNSELGQIVGTDCIEVLAAGNSTTLPVISNFGIAMSWHKVAGGMKCVEVEHFRPRNVLSIRLNELG